MRDGRYGRAPGRRADRAVSVTGTWSGLEAALGRLGTGTLPALGPERTARERYLGRAAEALRPAAAPLAEIFLHRRLSPGRALFLESRIVAALAALTDGLAEPEPESTGPALAPHEVAALRRVPELLWRARHAPPALAELARASSMSVRRLTSGFRALYGTSVRDHHRQRCLARAAELLVATDWPIARIAHEVGYASATNFGYAFRRAHATTPAAYRRAHT